MASARAVRWTPDELAVLASLSLRQLPPVPAGAYFADIDIPMRPDGTLAGTPGPASKGALASEAGRRATVTCERGLHARRIRRLDPTDIAERSKDELELEHVEVRANERHCFASDNLTELLDEFGPQAQERQRGQNLLQNAPPISAEPDGRLFYSR